MTVPACSVHAKIGLNGKALAIAIGRELGKQLSDDQVDVIDERHSDIRKELLPNPKLLPGASALINHLREIKRAMRYRYFR